MIVSEVPGTTRDAIDTVLQRGDRTFVLVDTAGLRRKRKQRQGIEYYSELRALQAAERADVALVLVDSSEGVVEQDLSVADIARKSHVLDARRALEVGHRGGRDRGRARAARAAAPPAPADRRRLGEDEPRGRQVLDKVEELYGKYTSRVPTGELNRFLASCGRSASLRPETASASTSCTGPRPPCARRASASSSTTRA